MAKQSHTYTALIIVLGFLLFCDCTKHDAIVSENDINLIQAKNTTELGLSRFSDSLSISDACIVSSLYQQDRTKAVRKSISNIIPIQKNGEVLMYAINYSEGGYLIVSATKKYYPILADVEKGEYTPSDVSSFLVDELALIIADTKKNNSDVSFHPAWHKYETQDVSSVFDSRTKVYDSIWDEYYEVLDGYYDDWIDEGYTVYFLHEQPEDMPNDIYQSYCTIAQEDEDLESIGLDYMYTSVILEKTTDSNTNRGPYLLTNWGQGNPWNSMVSGGYFLGCVTIATGQIMRYHEKPNTYSWNMMPDNTSNNILASFLAGLRSELHVSNDGSSTIYHAKEVLMDYDYSCGIVSHSTSIVVSQLNSQRPVYMRGFDSARDVGHAWVCDGYLTLSSQTEYKLYLLRTYLGHPNSLELFDSSICNYSNHTSLHMNWGFSGDHNGYYYDPYNIAFNNNGTTINYNTDRKDLIIIP